MQHDHGKYDDWVFVDHVERLSAEASAAEVREKAALKRAEAAEAQANAAVAERNRAVQRYDTLASASKERCAALQQGVAPVLHALAAGLKLVAKAAAPLPM
ncbi:hypothetical protein WJX81_005083 [Elliptochloris bilobata]|uniref:Uncharacterized protein n=1 Tax=Elliptochloris bilobata TaxID=381761 RepID=A0AAW1RF20_9CHLO